ncbi:Kinesin-like protein kip2 [Saitozyma podzolica]|uniref:Kinesin-like protein n=1 Tax=Saitozyma podzolica TaxID=1890683 RepID=A0A427YI66_9TREE|nr:Kinesin-like protein kip2 [Saitozyma podzolica]
MFTPSSSASARLAPISSSRPRQPFARPHSSLAQPLTTDRNSNTPSPFSFLNDDPASSNHGILPREGGGKLKIKSATTPEAKSRLLAKALPKTPAQPPRQESLTSAWVPQDRVEAMDAEEGPIGETEAVLVSVRVRPPNDAEMRSNQETSVWETPSWDEHSIKLPKGRDGVHQDREWMFDRILPPHTDNLRAYNTSAKAHVRSAMEGFNAVIFAYGQTASGKTFTLTGSPSNPGIIPLSVTDLFAQIRRTPDREFLLRASYLELYNETIIDLLSPSGRELTLSEGKKKGEVVINGLTECAVRTEEDVRGLLRRGEESRKVGQTDWNARSSRSHCVFRITIESRASRGQAEDANIGARTPGGRLKAAGDKTTRISTLSIIDLAGSEKHTSSKERNVEGRHINQSLLTLKLVISKLADMASKRNVTHVPYRDSKLTRLLQPSLSGDALISVICTVSPSALNLSESLSTLSFAQGLKRVVLRAERKEVVDPQALIQQDGGEETMTSKSSREKNQAMEKRLNELKSLILTSVNVQSSTGTHGQARPLSPTKLTYPKLDFDKSTTDLQEDLHAAQLRNAEQEDEIARLRLELEARPINPDARIIELQDEIAGLRMIAADYERHLLEPSRKVRDDVEKEWKTKVDKLEAQLESKKIWANRLDENFRAVTTENKQLVERCKDAESKVLQIMEWVNTALQDDRDPSSPSRNADVPMLVVSQDLDADDFGPSPSQAQNGLGGVGVGAGAAGPGSGPGGKATLTLSAKMTRAQFSQMDLASFGERFGTLTLGSRGRDGFRMLREESRMDLANELDDDTF